MIFNFHDEKIKNSVENLIKSRRFPHAVLIEGNSENERINLAEYLTKAFLCSADDIPCDKCDNCRLANDKNHPDITYVFPEENKKFISVNKIREVRTQAFVRPHSALSKVFIITEAHRMNEQAQNAFLKILEEPPKNVHFILLCVSKMQMLETVRSRCTQFTLNGDTAGDEKGYLINAQSYVEFLLSGKRYEQLKLLSQYEKDRASADEFLSALKEYAVSMLKSGNLSITKSRALTSLYSEIEGFKDLIKTNINLSLLFSAMVCGAKYQKQ